MLQANKAAWDAAAVGNMAHWDEKWLDITRLESIKPLMAARMVRATAAGCNAIEPDNTDCYDNDE